MLVTDKQADIAILRTLGLSPRGVMTVFVVQGSLIGVIGTLLGVVGGIVLTLNLEHILFAIEKVFGVTLLPEDVYYITGLPTELKTSDVVAIAAVALTMEIGRASCRERGCHDGENSVVAGPLKKKKHI